MTFEEFINHFEIEKRSNDKAQCFCPSHRDNEASLTISKAKDGKILLYCHAGCKTNDVLSSVNLCVSDMFDSGSNDYSQERWKAYIEKQEGKTIEGIYDYKTIDGSYAFTRVRLSGKKFIYGILSDSKFQYGLNKKKRKDIPAVYCKSIKSLKESISNRETIFFCEGEKDVNTLIKNGYAAITCGSATDWNSNLSDFLINANVVILADNDYPGIEMSKNIKKDLLGIAKNIKVIIPCKDIEHGDITDYFKNHNTIDFDNLVKNCDDSDIETQGNEDIEKEEETNLNRFHLFNDNGKITGVFDYAIFEYIKENNHLFVMGGVVFIYAHGVYIPDETGSRLKTLIRNLIYPRYVKSSTIRRIYDLFLSDHELELDFDELNNFPKHWINFVNGYYDPKEKRIIEHKAEYFSINQIPYEYNPGTKYYGEFFDKWIRFAIPDDEDREMFLQYSGLEFTTDVSIQKFLILNGDGGTGKSTAIRMNELAVGTHNVSNISLSELNQRFASYGLMGKLLNSCADLEISALEDTSTLKKCLGEDSLRAEKKGADAISFKNYSKLVFSTNELPIIKGEKTNGFYRRLLILEMNSIPETKDPELFSKLAVDIHYYIQMCVEALERLYQNGYILESQNSKMAVERMRCDSDTVQAFLQLECHGDKNSRIERKRLYSNYKNFCDENERQALTTNNFYKSMRSKGFNDLNCKSNGYYFFPGIALNVAPNTLVKIDSDDDIPFD